MIQRYTLTGNKVGFTIEKGGKCVNYMFLNRIIKLFSTLSKFFYLKFMYSPGTEETCEEKFGSI